MADDLTKPFVFEPMKSGGGGFNPLALGGLLFGGGDTGFGDFLTEEQQRNLQRQAMLQSAAALLQAGGRSPVPISLGQALGSALQAGTAGYQGAQQNAIQQLLTKQKMDEYKRQVADEEAYRNMFTQMPTAGAPMTPAQVFAVSPDTSGPTPQRAAMIGMPTPAGVSAAGGMPALTQVQRDILRTMTPKEGRAELLKLSQPPEITGQAFKGADGNYYYMTKQGPIPATIAPADLAAEEFGAAVPEVVGGQTQMVQYNKKGDRRVVTNVMPYEKPEASPAEVKLLEAAKMPVTMENIMAIRRSGASNVNVTQNAEKKGLELAYEQGVKDLGASRDMARSANATLANIDRILPALDTAITGPAADFRATLLRVGKQLNVAGADADQVLRNTATVVQGLAQQELAAAEQMRGQGSLTDAERAILRRAAGGDVSLTAGELRVGLLAAQRTARMRAESHGQLLSTAVRTIPSLAQIAPMYEVPVYGAQPTNPLQNAIQQEIDRRKASGGKR